MIFYSYEFFSRQFTRDEKYYTEPESFNPNRFLQNTSLGEGSHNPLKIVFGFGRRYAFHIICMSASINGDALFLGRICPGEFMVEAGMWMTIACALAAFDFKPPVGKDGLEYLPAITFTSGATR